MNVDIDCDRSRAGFSKKLVSAMPANKSIQRAETNCYPNTVKQDPARVRQNSKGRALTNFTQPLMRILSLPFTIPTDFMAADSPVTPLLHTLWRFSWAGLSQCLWMMWGLDWMDGWMAGRLAEEEEESQDKLVLVSLVESETHVPFFSC